MSMNTPVRVFMKRKMSTVERVEGLLKYGYDIEQIARMLNSSKTRITQIMEQHNFNELKD